VFTYPTFDVDITREIVLNELGWPAPGDASDESGLGCNREYADLRRLGWKVAKNVHAAEGELIERLERAEDPAAEYDKINDEAGEDGSDLLGLDIGVAAVVASLSAVGCVPFTSCNGGAYGHHHHEAYPLVAFFAKPWMADLLLGAAADSGIGLANQTGGCVVAYADDIRRLRAFAEIMISRSSLFRAASKQKEENVILVEDPEDGDIEQYELPFDRSY
jgi:hypothetical protein